MNVMKQTSFAIGLLAALVTANCGGNNALAPSAVEAPAPKAPTQISYDINLPDQQMVANMTSAYPNGVTDMTPVQAQAKFDYTQYYGTPNVYAGPVMPNVDLNVYQGIGILIAPLAVASKMTFLGSEWGAMENKSATYSWIGHFTLARRGTTIAPPITQPTPKPPTTPTTPTPPTSGGGSTSTAFTKTGTGDTTFDIPTTVTKVHVTASYDGTTANFIVGIAGKNVINEVIGSDEKPTSYDGTLTITGGTVVITRANGVKWSFTEVK